MDKEMMRALEADGEKLAALTGEDHGPYFLSEKCIQTSDTDMANVATYGDYFPDNDNVATGHSSNPVDALRNMFAILHNVAMWDLEDAGVIRKGDEDKWRRFNNDLTTFVLKLDDARLGALYALVQSRQPARYRDPSVTQVAEAALANDNVPGAVLKTGEDTVVVRAS